MKYQISMRFSTDADNFLVVANGENISELRVQANKAIDNFESLKASGGSLYQTDPLLVEELGYIRDHVQRNNSHQTHKSTNTKD